MVFIALCSPLVAMALVLMLAIVERWALGEAAPRSDHLSHRVEQGGRSER
jgi:hypothetical protein